MKIVLSVALVLGFSIPVLAGPDISSVRQVRSILDPKVRAFPHVQGSMIGGCAPGTNQAPVRNPTTPNDLCLVYLVEGEQNIPAVEAMFESLIKREGIYSSVAVRFQKGFGPMEEQ